MMKIFISTSSTELAAWFLKNHHDLHRRAAATFFATRRGFKNWLPEIELALKGSGKTVDLNDRVMAAKQLASEVAQHLPTLEKLSFDCRAFIDPYDNLYVLAYAPALGVTSKTLHRRCNELSKETGLKMSFILEGKTVKIAFEKG